MTKTRIQKLIDLLDALNVVCGIDNDVKDTIEEYCDFKNIVGVMISEAQTMANDIKEKDIVPF